MTTQLTRRQMFTRSASVATGVGVALAIGSSVREGHAEPSEADIGILNALLSAEYNAINLYKAAVKEGGVIDGAADASTNAASVAFASLVKSVAGHFQSQHEDHVNALKALAGSMAQADPGAYDANYVPALFNGTTYKVLDVVKLAANKEKGAAIAYADTLKAVSDETAAQLISSIGGTETQHFVVLYLIAEGLIAPTDALTGSNAATNLASVVPASFVLNSGNGGSLEQFNDIPFES